jgi:GT2 family glycosyltransferase/Flp pilus assembly protein TadD
MDNSRGTVDTPFQHARRDGANSLVSVVVLTHNQIEYTQVCIESVIAHTRTNFELIVVDNGSVDGTVEFVERMRAGASGTADISLIRNQENLGFAAGNNQGIRVARGDYIVLMNNDLVVPPGWLRRMLACMGRSPQIGLVGPMTNYVSGPQLVANVPYDPGSLEGLWDFARRFHRDHTGQAERTTRVVGFCMLIRRAVIERIGGLDGRFGLGNFEDDDFCLRAALAGFESWIAKDCFVHHFGSRTFLGANMDYMRSLQENWEIFKSKWGLPQDLSMDRPYEISHILQRGFDPRIHYVPVDRDSTADETERNVPLHIAEKLLQGERFFEQGRYDDAEGLLQEVISADPDHPVARNDLACLYWQQGRKSEALQELTKAMTIDPENRDAVWNFGQFLTELGRQQQTEALYSSYLERHPDEMEMKEALGECRDQGRAEPREPFSGGIEAHLASGRALLREGHFQEAEQVFRKLIESSPGDMQIHEDLACLLWETERKAEALGELARVLELDRDNPDGREILRRFLSKLNGDRQDRGPYPTCQKREPVAGEAQKACQTPAFYRQRAAYGRDSDSARDGGCRSDEPFMGG